MAVYIMLLERTAASLLNGKIKLNYATINVIATSISISILYDAITLVN
jgi:hypothetical protein